MDVAGAANGSCHFNGKTPHLLSFIFFPWFTNSSSFFIHSLMELFVCFHLLRLFLFDSRSSVLYKRVRRGTIHD
ncbi:hypothetical protein LguiA_028755 [Lonicera macranthoides]